MSKTQKYLAAIMAVAWAICVFFSLSTCAQQERFRGRQNAIVSQLDTLYEMYTTILRENDSLRGVIAKHKYYFLRDSLYQVSGVQIPGYFPDNYIDSVLKYSKEFDIPLRLHIRLIYTESNFHENSRSWAGAYGLYQLMPMTRWGLINNDHCTKSDFQRGCFLLRKMKDNDGTWERALTHYNTGNPNGYAVGYVNKILR